MVNNAFAQISAQSYKKILTYARKKRPEGRFFYFQ